MNEAGQTQERGPRRKWEMKWGMTEVPVCGRQEQLATELGGLLNSAALLLNMASFHI